MSNSTSIPAAAEYIEDYITNGGFDPRDWYIQEAARELCEEVWEGRAADLDAVDHDRFVEIVEFWRVKEFQVRAGITSDSRVCADLSGDWYTGASYAEAEAAMDEATEALRSYLEAEADCRGGVRRLGGDYAAAQMWADFGRDGCDLLRTAYYTAADLEEDRDREELERETRGLGSASPTPEGLADHWAA